MESDPYGCVTNDCQNVSGHREKGRQDARGLLREV